MSSPTTPIQDDSSRVPLRIRTREPKVRGANRTFVRDFRIGRDNSCDVSVASGLVSRVHTSVEYAEGQWWVCDEDSTNGTYLDGEAVQRAPLTGDATLQLGQNGPVFQLAVQAPSSEEGADVTRAEDAETTRVSHTIAESADGDESAPSIAGSDASAGAVSASRRDPSVSQYIEYYFNDRDEPAGEHTRMLRQAYQRVKTEQQRKYTWALVGVLVLCVGLGAYAIVQHLRNERLEQQAEQMFSTMKEVDMQVARLRQQLEESEDATLTELLAEAQARRQRLHAQYAGYVEELDLYRELSDEEREIYRVARIFRESEFSIPAGFVRQVKETIENYWLREPHRSDFVSAIERAEENEYTPYIVETLHEHGLPPEFFYLALQESKFREDTTGPPTRWGVAKGMWQFIPSTAREYGLQVGPREDTRVCEPQDERCDFRKATEAAARYLQAIYSTEAQASGLLVIASYNWGEHRVIGHLERIPGPQSIPDEAFEDIPEDPEKRNYWRFLNEYEDRMPEETKDYVLKVVAAAVIGQNPRLFGFDFDNPLREHIEEAVQQDTFS